MTMTHTRIVPDEPWHYGLRRAPGGGEESRVFPLTYSWDELKQDALRSEGRGTVLAHFTSNPWLVVAWWQVAPQRLDRDSLYALVEAVVPGWGT
jgi:hypothetical protein